MVKTFPSSGRQIGSCRTWLRVYDSEVATVADGVKDLTLIGSKVDTVKLVDQRDFMAINSTIKFVEALEWKGYRATIQNTTIVRLKDVVAHDSLYILNAHFGLITPGGILFEAREMSVVNSTIRRIFTQGLTIESGAVSFSNVTIGYLEWHAIQVASPHGFLALTNVTIEAASTFCIALLDRERISLSNVTVHGTLINQSSSFLQFLYDGDTITNERVTLVEEAAQECHAVSTVLACDFANSSKEVKVRGEDVQNYKQIQVRNARHVQVDSTNCEMELKLQNVNATLPHITTFPADVSGPCNVSVSALNSSLNVVWTKHINTLNVTNSTIKRLHGGRLDALWLTKSVVEEMDGVEVGGKGAVWNNTMLLGPINVTLKAPLHSSSVHLPLVAMWEGSLTVDHPGSTSRISGWRVSWMKRHSVVVRRGSTLELNDVVALRVTQEAVYLEEGAKVRATHLRALQDSVYIFSVASKDQVEFTDAALSTFSDSLIQVRSPPRSVDDQSNLTVSDTHTSAYCSTIPLYLQICDFSAVTQDEVVVDLASGKQSNRVIVKGAASVTIFPPCVEKVILMDVTTATTVDNERECATWLEATGVHLINVTSGVHDVTLTSCTVDLLAPDRQLRDVDLESSSVKRLVGVHWAGYTGVFNSSQLGKVQSLRADSRLMMSNSSVAFVPRGGMFLAAEAIIVNTTFKEIQESGIVVNGSARMQDVVIEKLAKGGIQVLDGLLLFVNVQIIESEEESITAGVNGGVSFQNVTVGGKKVRWHGYLISQSTTFNQSLIFLNEVSNENNKTFTRPPSSTAAQIVTTAKPPLVQSSPQASSMIQWHLTSSSSEARTSVAPNMLVTSTYSSWKWAGAGIGFFMGLLVGCCIFVAVKVVKPNKGMLTLPTVFWKVKDDQHELLTEDNGIVELPNSRKDQQQYSALPSSEVI